LTLPTSRIKIHHPQTSRELLIGALDHLLVTFISASCSHAAGHHLTERVMQIGRNFI